MTTTSSDTPAARARIGLFGGTFDPIHFGHLRSALEVLERFALDRVVLIPAAVPPHKTDAVVSAASDRLAMTARAVAAVSGLEVCDAEIRRRGTSFTIDTVHQFQAEAPGATDWFLLLGTDAFFDMASWRRYRELFSRIRLVVMVRPTPAEGDRTDRLHDRMGRFLRLRVSGGYAWDPERLCFAAPGWQTVHPCAVTPLAIAASGIRRRISQGHRATFLVPPSVEEWIATKGLYR